MAKHYLEVTQEAGKAFFSRNLEGPVHMLNLLRFKETADYSEDPRLQPATPISGYLAYRKYMDHTLPFLHENGGEVIFEGTCSHFLIGPESENWYLFLLVRHQSKEIFLNFASNKQYQEGVGHRKAALADSRLLPVW